MTGLRRICKVAATRITSRESEREREGELASPVFFSLSLSLCSAKELARGGHRALDDTNDRNLCINESGDGQTSRNCVIWIFTTCVDLCHVNGFRRGSQSLTPAREASAPSAVFKR